MTVSEADVIAAVRTKTLAPSTFSDEDLMKAVKGSLLLARIRMWLAVRDCGQTIIEAVRETLLGRFVRWLVHTLNKVTGKKQ